MASRYAAPDSTRIFYRPPRRLGDLAWCGKHRQRVPRRFVKSSYQAACNHSVQPHMVPRLCDQVFDLAWIHVVMGNIKVPVGGRRRVKHWTAACADIIVVIRNSRSIRQIFVIIIARHQSRNWHRIRGERECQDVNHRVDLCDQRHSIGVRSRIGSWIRWASGSTCRP